MTGCRCGHDRAAHAHYRAGTDCALCSCPRLRRRWRPRVARNARPRVARADTLTELRHGLIEGVPAALAQDEVAG